MRDDLRGRRALITGASRGIGAAIANAFATAGAETFCVSRATGVDLYDRAQRAALPDDFDILINCAGAQHHFTALDYPIDIWDGELEINLTASFDLCRHVAPKMIARRWGRIINFASIAGMQGTRGIIAYSVAKAGVIELTKCLSNEWSPHGLTVNCIAPGYIDTEMLKPLTNSPTAAETVKGRIPMGRFGAPEEVVGAVLFLCGDQAKYISGITIPVDGGWMAR